MKHPASTAAILLLGLAFLVGGATWLLSGSQADDGQVAQLPTTASSDQVGFVAVTPQEQHKKMTMERVTRQFKRIREVGEEVAPNLFMIPDADGDPTYYITKLYKAVGRNGEPLYMSGQMKRRRAAPMLDPKKYIQSRKENPTLKPAKGSIKIPKVDKQSTDASGVRENDANSGAVKPAEDG